MPFCRLPITCWLCRSALILAFGFEFAGVLDAADSLNQQAAPKPSQVAIEALQKLKGIDLETHPALKAAVMKVLHSARGTAQFVEIVRDFNIKGESESLLEYAIAHPDEAAGVEALRLVIAQGYRSLIAKSLTSDKAGRLVKALANAPDKETAHLLEPLITTPAVDEGLRKQVVHALAQTQTGAEFLLDLAATDPDLQPLVAAELRNARWPAVHERATALLTPSTTRSPLPPITELVKRTGDADRGAKVFRRETVGCNLCHKVNGEGTDFGPDLSGIGTKLAREALYEAILDPNAGISFGYEAWQVELRNGEEAYGLLASETADELVIKAQSGILSRFKKSEITNRVKQKSSIMPSGLAEVMSEKDLVDLVEYLSSLRAPGPLPAGVDAAPGERRERGAGGPFPD